MSRPRVLVARAPHQRSRLSDRLEAIGLEPVEVALLAIAPPTDDGAALHAAVADLAIGHCAAMGLTSPNGVDAVGRVLQELDATLPADLFVGCVGPGTAGRMREVLGSDPDLVAPVHTTVGLADAFPAANHFAGTTPPVVVLPRADRASPQLPEVLRARGWHVRDVTAYRTLLVTDVDPSVRTGLVNGAIDVVAAASPSTVEALVGVLDGQPLGAELVAIGPVTAARALQHGLDVAAQADPHDLDGLVTAVRRTTSGH